MWRDHDATAEVGEDLAGIAIELEDRIDRIVITVDRFAATECAGAAAFIGPDVTVDRIDIDAGRRTPFTAVGKLAPVRGDIRRGIRNAFAGDRVSCWRWRGAPRNRCGARSQ
jgi:hypothetical protein